MCFHLLTTLCATDFDQFFQRAVSVLQVDLVKVPNVSRIWDSSASGFLFLFFICPILVLTLLTGARSRSTIWCPKLPGPSNNRHHFNLGHYVSEGISSNLSDTSIKRLYLTLTDTTSWRVFQSQYLVKEIIDVILPMPVKYIQVWMQRRGERQLYVWKPIPPTDSFVGLGMLATTSGFSLSFIFQ